MIHILMSQRSLCSPFLPPPATSQDHFLFRAQVDPSAGHKGVMLKTRHSFQPDIAHGGSSICGEAALTAAQEGTAGQVLCVAQWVSNWTQILETTHSVLQNGFQHFRANQKV
jgi:hypothetical protein